MWCIGGYSYTWEEQVQEQCNIAVIDCVDNDFKSFAASEQICKGIEKPKVQVYSAKVILAGDLNCFDRLSLLDGISWNCRR